MALTSVADKSERTSSADGLLSVKEAADLLRMSDKWLYQSDIPFVRMGRRRLYFRANLLEYARQRLSNVRSGAK
jgi:excisionase family DNA binding protein